jgi:dGTPase
VAFRLNNRKVNWYSLLSYQRMGHRPTGEYTPSRSAFEQDYDRIIFSHPFRRLQDKTQVHPLPEHDFVHTRLTHSLEVSSVGRSLGKKVGEVILQRHPQETANVSQFDFGAIVAAAALTHDLGNPPFGHAGEDAISDFFAHHEAGKIFRTDVDEACWQDLVRFEGNAQGFRILNKNIYGLKLTFATLGAFTKYPCPSLFSNRDKSKKSQKKYGFYQSEKEVFQTLAGELQLTPVEPFVSTRHPLALLVEAADDICYSIIDLEDGCNLGLVPYSDARELYEGVISRSRTKLGKLASLNSLSERVGYLRALAIGDLMEECATLFLDHEQDIMEGKFDHALADHCPSKDGLKAIIDQSVHRIYRARQVVEIEATGHEVLPGLLEEFTKAGDYLMKNMKSRKYSNLQLLFPEETRLAILDCQRDTYAMLRQVLDFVSGLTDRHALSLFRKLKGINL